MRLLRPQCNCAVTVTLCNSQDSVTHRRPSWSRIAVLMTMEPEVPAPLPCSDNPPTLLATPSGVHLFGAADEVIQLDTPDALAQLPARLQDWQRRHPAGLACGLLGYDGGNALHGIDTTRADTPLALVHLYRDRQHLQTFARDALPALSHAHFSLRSRFTADLDIDAYREAIARVHAYELAGDCYQINFARRLQARYQGCTLAAFERLYRQHPAPWASYFPLPGGGAVFGVSPECFLRIRGNRLVTEPIKGSRPRGDSAAADAALGRELEQSLKDRAENLMIVDLLRNDLGQVAVPGSVCAAPLFELRRFSNVQHLVSTVTARLRQEVHPIAALLACFPGGSITGAPKKRAMQIIAELERGPRGFYCGSQFYLDSDGNLDANILIRTFQARDGHISCYGGGGVVIDSCAEQEFEESQFKIEALIRSLEDNGQA